MSTEVARVLANMGVEVMRAYGQLGVDIAAWAFGAGVARTISRLKK